MSNRPRRKCASVSFASDDDVVQHIVPVGEIRKTGKRNANRRRSEPHLKYREDVQNDDNSDGDESDCDVPVSSLPSILECEEGMVDGSNVFQFRTPKKSGGMAQKASEARTPKSILKKTQESENTPDKKTPKRGKHGSSTPSSKSGILTPSVKPVAVTPSQRGRPPKHLDKRKPETTTPYKLRQRLVEDDDIESESSDSSSDDSDDENKDVSSRYKSSQSAAKRHKQQNEDSVDMPSMIQDYFDIHSHTSVVTSDRTLAKLGASKMDQEALNKVLSKIPARHAKECALMYQENRALFKNWMFQLSQGFNVLLYGLGSKRALLEDFRKATIKDLSHVVVNGYFPSLTVKSILNTIIYEILDHNGSFKSPLDSVEFIKEELGRQGIHDFFLILHNIDGVMLRGEKTQNILSLLAQIPEVHIIGSIDHINAPLIWDQGKCSRFNWIWYDATTFLPYTDETSYENSLLVQQSGSLALSSMSHVMKSLTPNAKSIFLLLAKYQLENADNSTYVGMPLTDLYQRCREAFLVNSDLTLQAQLIEFRDHKLIKSVKGYDGIEHLKIPIDTSTLTEFVEQQDNS